MYQCNYCKRYLKDKYENCPGCGSNSFKKVASYTEKIIKTPPEGGYKINISNYNFEKKKLVIPIVIVIYIVLFVGLFDLIFVSTGASMQTISGDSSFGSIFLLFGLFALFVPMTIILTVWKAVREEKKGINKNIDKVKKLSQHGMLIKNLPYELVLDKTSNYAKSIYRIKVLYEIEKGRTLSLKSEPKYLTSLGREDGTVDLLIDPDDYTNYFIDFEIY